VERIKWSECKDRSKKMKKKEGPEATKGERKEVEEGGKNYGGVKRRGGVSKEDCRYRTKG